MKRIIIEFNNKAKSPIRKKFLKKIAEKILQDATALEFEKRGILISFANVSEREMKKINAFCRQINKATDVLSFPASKNEEDIEYLERKKLFLGEILLCYDNIASYARRHKLDVKDELCQVVAHGILHLLGYRHGPKMFGVQKKIKNHGKIRKIKNQPDACDKGAEIRS